MFMTAIVTHGWTNLAVPIMSAEKSAMTAHTTSIVAQEKSAVMAGTVCRLALRLMLLGRRHLQLPFHTVPTTPIVG